MQTSGFRHRLSSFFLFIKPTTNSIPLLDRIKLLALYAISVVVLVGAVYNMNILLDYRLYSRAILLGFTEAVIITGLVLFFRTRYLLYAQIPGLIAIFILALDSILSAGGVYGFGVLYFISAVPLVYLFFGLGIGVSYAVLFYLGILIRFRFGHFNPFSVYNNVEYVYRIAVIMGIATALGIIISFFIELFIRHLTRLAYVDRITLLPNRYKLEEYLQRAVYSGKDRKRPFTLMGIKIMNYTKISAMLGTELGDQMLALIGERIRSCLPDSRITARWSGSLFLAVLETTDRTVLEGYNTAILDALAPAFPIGNRSIVVNGSVGVCRYPEDVGTSSALISNVSSLIDRNANNPGELLYYDGESLRREQYRFSLIEAMSRADFNRDFTLVYQPKIRLSDEACVGAEVLLRWTEPEIGQISPSVFIPLSEETGFIRKITRWVIRRCFSDLVAATGQSWLAGRRTIYAINLSVIDLKDRDLIPFIKREISDCRWLTGSIEFEITEGVLIDDDPEIRKNIAQLIDLGFRIAIDDFGTGYSCLSYLHTIRVQNLKIDQSFIRGISGLLGAASVPVIDAIISMGKAFNLEITAEGVENEEQAAYLRSRDCDLVQGWKYSKGIPFDEYLEYLAGYAVRQ